MANGNQSFCGFLKNVDVGNEIRFWKKKKNNRISARDIRDLALCAFIRFVAVVGANPFMAYKIIGLYLWQKRLHFMF